MNLTRNKDWQDRLDALVLVRLRAPFAWGGHDCVLFAADAVLAMTGTDPAAAWRGQWTSAREAFRLLRPLGGLAAAAAGAGLPEVPPRMAQRGDVVLLRAPGRAGSMRGALGVCLGERIAAPGGRGLVMAGLGEGVRAWRV